LLLRATVGVAAVVSGGAALAGRAPLPSAGAMAVGVTAVGCGVLLLIGFLTPGAALLTALGSAGATLPGCPALAANLFEAKPTASFLIVMAVAIVLLGPGAFSLDSYLFGRREIVIPPSRR
jgi:uncharacterized membrane protein YphA (DoxX/SURF4 family)